MGSTQTVVTVLHDLPLALQADRLLLMDRGRIVGDGAHDDPRLHVALSALFGNALRIVQIGPRFVALPEVGD